MRANVGSEADYDENGRSYGNSLDLMRKLPPIIKTLCVDRTWIRTTTKTSFRKILFKNGMYDGDTGIFHNIRDTPFNPDIVFHVRIDRPFPTDIDAEYMDDLRQRLFFDPLSPEQGQFFLQHLSRGLFGDAAEMGVMFWASDSPKQARALSPQLCYRAVAIWSVLSTPKISDTEELMAGMRLRRCDGHCPIVINESSFRMNAIRSLSSTET